MFIKENVNPKNKKTGDCVLRAIAKAEDKTWIKVFDELTEIARSKFTVLNNKDAYEFYLKKYPTIEVKYETSNGRFRYTVKQVSEFKGTYIVAVAGHLTCVIDGNIYDTWDCSKKSAYKIWRIK